MLKIGTRLGLKGLVQGFAKPLVANVNKTQNILLLNAQSIRNTSFFNRLTQQQLWKGVTSVSNAGKRRGRGRGNKRGMRNLNEGKIIGEGKERVLWPGLNYAVLGKDGIREIKKLPEGEKKSPALAPTQIKLRKPLKLHPLSRGWSGRYMKGRFIDPPDPVQDETFENFKTVILANKLSATMSAVLGRKRKYFSVVATGNTNGLVGVGVAKAMDSKASIKLAKNRASRRLLTIDLIEKKTVNHDFFSEYGRTKITVLKKPEGYGLCCHRVIAALCKLIGIENLYAKLEGPSNTIHIIRAFLVGLLRQKTYQQIADEKKLHVVEFREETFNFPQVLASPQECLTPAEARKNPVSFEEYIMGGKVIYNRGKKTPFYMKLPGWSTYLKRTLYSRNHDKVKLDLIVKYGSHMSHLTKAYPECVGHREKMMTMKRPIKSESQ